MSVLTMNISSHSLSFSLIHWIQWQKYSSLKGFKPATSCGRDHNASIAPARHMWETEILNWAQFIHQWFIRYPEFAEITKFNKSSASFGKTPIIVSHNFHCRKCLDGSQAALCPFSSTHRQIMLRKKSCMNVQENQASQKLLMYITMKKLMRWDAQTFNLSNLKPKSLCIHY